MTAAIRCACGWRGPLLVRSPCPACGGNHHKRLTAVQLGKLGAFRRGEQPVMAPNQRDWFVRWGLIKATGPAPKPTGRRVGRFKRQPFALTALGMKVSETHEEWQMAGCGMRGGEVVTAKRFFKLDDNDEVFYHLVAADLEGAKAMLRASGSLFGSDEDTLDEATGLTWTELTDAQVRVMRRCHTEDDRGVIALADADIGDWFCSEWWELYSATAARTKSVDAYRAGKP